MLSHHSHATDARIPPHTRISRVDRVDGVLVQVAPVLGTGPDGEPVEGDVAAQVAQVYANRTAALASQGAALADITRIVGYAVPGMDLDPLWELDPLPGDSLATGALVIVPALPDPALLYQESVTAMLPQHR